MMTRRKPQHAAGAFVRLRPSGGLGGATDGPRIGSTEQLAKGSIRQSGDSHRRLPPEVSRLQHFHRLASPATFPPTECLMTPVSYSPRPDLSYDDASLSEAAKAGVQSGLTLNPWTGTVF